MPIGMIRGLGFAAAVLSVTGATAASHQWDADPVFLEFQQRVASYAGLHTRLAAALPPQDDPGTPHAIVKTRAELASVIKAARPNARQGDIFTPEAVQKFRSLITVALRGHDAEALLRHLFEEHPGTVGLRLRVHDNYPGWATQEMSALLLQYLPALPDRIEYRLVDHDLVLLDIPANLIVDVLPEAIPRSGSSRSASVGAQAKVDAAMAQQAFESGIRRYVDLRRRLEPSLPPLRTSDAEELTHAVRALGAAIQAARATALAGDIFCEAVDELFRGRIADVLAAGNTVNDLLAEPDDEPSFGVGPVIVNNRFPNGRGNAVLPTVLRALPALPPELQYRFVDRDLVLIDIDAGLVVDVLRDALPG